MKWDRGITKSAIPDDALLVSSRCVRPHSEQYSASRSLGHDWIPHDLFILLPSAFLYTPPISPTPVSGAATNSSSRVAAQKRCLAAQRVGDAWAMLVRSLLLISALAARNLTKCSDVTMERLFDNGGHKYGIVPSAPMILHRGPHVCGPCASATLACRGL